MATAAITPAAPISIQDLALSSTASDPDGDALTTTYAWRIDGVPVNGQSSTTLSHTVHAKGDIVTGITRVSDGLATTAAEASVTILDSPGNVVVPSPPTGVLYDNTVTFTAVASDYDGDDTSTKNFRLVYGPAGMGVHPDTGVVSWTARGPMFERTLRVSYGVSIDELGAGVATGSLVVTDPSHVPPLMRGTSGHPGYGGLRIGDFDADGDLETLVAGYNGIYELTRAAGGGYEQAWADFLAFGNADFPTAMAAGDVVGNNRAEIFVAYGSTIVMRSGTDRAIAARLELPVPTNYMCSQLELADLDGNGSEELVCLATYFTDSNPDALGTILVLAADTLTVVKQYPLGTYGAFLAVGNVDNDAALELVTAAGYVFDGIAAAGASFAAQWPNPPVFGWTVESGDVDGDGIAEIIGLDNGGSVIRAFDARTRTQRWSVAHANPVALHVGDVTGDATAEVLVGDFFTGLVTAYRQSSPSSASTLFSIEFGNNAGVGAIAAGNLDADGGIEIIAGGSSSAWFGVAGRNPNPEIEWRLGDSLEAYGFLGGEELGAELTFLAAATDGNLRFARFDTADGDIALSGPLSTSGDLDAALAVADYDDDGVREALLAAEDENNVETHVLAYDLAANAMEWSTGGGVAESGPADIAYADFTGDGQDELVVLTEAGGLRVYDVGLSTPIYERAGVTAAESADVAVANLDGDGALEILATIDNRVVVFSRSPTGFDVTATSAQFVGIAAMEVTDIDGDGATDIFVLHGDSGQLARLNRFLLLQGNATLGQPATDMTTERSSFARKNLVFWRRDFVSDVFAADPVSGAEIWRGPRFNGFIGPDSVRYHDLAGNGDWSISVGASPGVTLTR
jgi:hypothetical protein